LLRRRRDAYATYEALVRWPGAEATFESLVDLLEAASPENRHADQARKSHTRSFPPKTVAVKSSKLLEPGEGN
jgi:hypothetical protein